MSKQLEAEQPKLEEQSTERPLFVVIRRDKNNGLCDDFDFDFDRENINFKNAKKITESKPDKSEKFSPFESAISAYQNQMDAFAEGTKLIDILIPAIRSMAIESNVVNYVKKRGKPLTDGTENTFSLASEHIGGFADAVKRAGVLSSYINSTPRMTLTSIVAAYDGFLTNLLHALFTANSDILKATNRKIEFSEVLNAISLADLVENAKRREVEAVVRQSHEDHFEWIEGKLGIPLRKGLERWPEFIEICERRNLLTHSNGIVSQHYLDKCKQVNYLHAKPIELGQKLTVTRRYLINATNVFYEIGIKLGHVVWRKVSELNDKNPEKNYSHVCFTLVNAKKYQLAERLLEFGVAMPKLSETYLRIMTVNYANAVKLMGDKSRALAILEKLQWETCSINYQICVAAVRDQNGEVIRLMRQCGRTGEVLKEHFIDWPVFELLRSDMEFRKAYEEVFGSNLDEDEIHWEDKKNGSEPELR